MAGGKLPPRQKMIGMMYLVLTALLAMNVSKDILNAFVTVNNGLEKTKHNFKDKNDDQYRRLLASYNENNDKFGEAYTKSETVKVMANDLVKYLDDLKVKIIDGIEPEITEDQIRGKNEANEDTILDLKYVKVKDNYLFSTQMLVGSEPSNPKTGEYSAMELQGKLIAFKEALEKLTPSDHPIRKSLEDTYSFEEKTSAGGNVENWPSYNFYGVPAAATITLLTKMQTDVRAFEADVVKHLYGKADELTYKFTNLAPAVIPHSNYVLQGDTFTAKVFLAAFDTTMSPRIMLGDGLDSTDDNKIVVTGEEIPVEVIKGDGLVKIPTSTQGMYSYKGVIEFKGPGGMEYHPYSINYQVAAPSATVSATAMNVFYIGVDNPVDIAASGVAKDKIAASITNGNITKSSDGWVVRVSRAGDATINVSAEVDGSNQSMGSKKFRVKTIPSPTPKIGGKTGGAIRKAALAASSGIRADLEGFVFDINVTVKEYTFGFIGSNGLLNEKKYTTNRFTPEVKNKINGLRRNSKVFFEDIKVIMPDGKERTLSSISFKVI